ncbi:bifunctional precorrin-2 dehydrogenase/sirohydrochlorin ferrochelatase [Sphingomonas sp. dw_22]|uniref:precorrin-2 dehydrogenase/sirohydrochlorin ferrochelatase family protein n=1 Tax=Sphingomonas sp. dw_22 TaxID=2721175 RepID=UPI001BD6BF5F|nr:bifunctional precorrin-2 dehydrogenase/sirohydrochlorin ferrochelatase [Sphingomonas sp. dw_22]
MSLPALPIFVRLAGRAVMLIGDGEAADAKRRLLERTGASIVGEDAEAALAIVALAEPEETVARLRARGVLVNAVDRPDLCDFTLPAIVDRDPVIVAVGTGGTSAGLAAALRQRLEGLLPASLGQLARELEKHKAALRQRWPDPAERRRMLGAGLAGPLDPLAESREGAVGHWIASAGNVPASGLVHLRLTSPDPDDLTLRQARLLAQADRVFHLAGVPDAILNRARADAPRLAISEPPAEPGPGLSILVEMAG